jgi:hypothetical protein
MPSQSLTPTTLTVILAGLISLLATLIPGFRTWFAGLASEVKQSLMAVATIVIAVAVYGLACTPSLGFTFVACPTGGIWELIGVIVVALTANQGVDRIVPKPEDVKAVLAAKKATGAA